MALYDKQQSKIQKMNVVREMLAGFKFSLRLEAIKAKIFTDKKIKK